MNTNQAIATSLALAQAEVSTLRALLEATLQHIGLQEIDGVPVARWIEARKAEELEKVLLRMGDLDPAAHDAVLACIAESAKKSRAI